MLQLHLMRSKRLQFPGGINRNLACVRRNWTRGNLASGPADPDLARRFRPAEHLDYAILRPIAAAGMDFAHCSLLCSEFQPELRTDSEGIARRTFESHAKSRFSL